MNDAELGGTVRALRHRLGWRQTDLAARAGVSTSLISLVECGQADVVTIRRLRRIAAALQLRLSWDGGYRGPELARMRDADHAKLAEGMVKRLQSAGWQVIPEASFNHYGDRGRIDLLAYHAATGAVLVIEIKTVIADLEELLGAMSAKERVAPSITRGLGWRPAMVVPLLVVAESTTNRRRLATHSHLFARFALRGKPAVAWLRQPNGAPSGLLLLVKLPHANSAGGRRAGRQRVRAARASPNVDLARERAPGVSQPA